MGLLDTLLGRREQSAAKAVTGSGAYWMEHGVPVSNMSRDPSRRIAEALRLYTSNDHVYTCESTIGEKFVTVNWHLEDPQGETVDPDDPRGAECYALLRNGTIDPLAYPAIQPGDDQKMLVSRHMGLPGTAFLFLDQLNDLGLPARTMVITPSRMTPAGTADGILKGWIVDADRPDGVDPVPLNADEVIVFTLEPPDFGHFGIGKAEAAWRKAGLANSTTRFAEGTMLSGGSKRHVIWPDGVTVEGEQWDAWVNNLRSSNEDASFSKRLMANRFPIGSLETGQSLQELDLPDIAALSQQDIYAIWKMPESQVGRTTPAGLNSGGKQGFEEAALWQNAVEPRLKRWVKPIQQRIVDRYGLTLILEVPEFDDDAPKYDIANNATTIPLKVDERRTLVGLDPLDEAVYGKLGQAILIAQTMVELAEKQEVPDNLIPFAGRDTARRDDDADEMPAPGEVTGKAKLVFTDLRQRLAKQYVPRMEREIQAALTAQQAALRSAVLAKYDHLKAKPGDDQAWWNEQREHRRIEQALAPVIEVLIQDSGRRLRSGFFASAKADNFIDRVADYVRVKVGDRIRGINTTTRDAIRLIIADGVREGLGPAALGDRIEAATQFNENRAELIARTEAAQAYNDTAIGTYRAFDVEEVQAIDGDQDDECAARNGQVFTLAEASGITDHPNGTLDWVPVVKAQLPQQETPVATIPQINLSIPVTMPEFPEVKVPPAQVTVNVEKPDPVIVNVEKPDAPQVTVNVPEQPAPVVNIPEAKATTPQEVIVTQMPRRVHSAIRDADGKVKGSVEDDA